MTVHAQKYIYPLLLSVKTDKLTLSHVRNTVSKKYGGRALGFFSLLDNGPNGSVSKLLPVTMLTFGDDKELSFTKWR